MIPDFTVDGYLPPGIHVATLDEFINKFVYGIRRKQIFEGLLRLINDLKDIGCNVIYVDGSYVSTKERPGDIDVCWEMMFDPTYLDFAKRKQPIIFMTNGARAEQHGRYNADVFPANVPEGATGLMFLDFFQKIKNTDGFKGIIKIELI